MQKKVENTKINVKTEDWKLLLTYQNIKRSLTYSS